jgi:hypothetical protein
LMASCDHRIVVISDEPPQILSRLFAGDRTVDIRPFPIGAATGTMASYDQRVMVVLEETYVWPRDPVEVVLAQQALDAFRVSLDPVLISIYSRTAIPPERAPRASCPDQAGR